MCYKTCYLVNVLYVRYSLFLVGCNIVSGCKFYLVSAS
jgi:hypothetical protein